MRIAKFVGLSLLATVTMVSTACATGTSSAMANATGSVARKKAQAPLESAAMIISQPKLVDVAVAASTGGKHDEADTAFILAASDPSESAVETTQAWINHMQRRLPSTVGMQGLEDLDTAVETGNRLTVRVVEDRAITHDVRTTTLAKIARTVHSVRDRADKLASEAARQSRVKADEGDNLWTPNDREKIHDALVMLAPFSIHSSLLSHAANAEVMAAKAYALSYVSESEHQMMLINAGHIKK
ncbi:MAG: hypothetical protein RLY21_1422 [Planctomycetota bacterium]|jgi:hypothetical protein